MHIFLMRGLPGSGKTSWIKAYETAHYVFPQKWVVCSADHYHLINGVYQYKPENARSAHDDCLHRYLAHLINQNADVMFVDNTNTTLVELAPYYRLAELYQAEVKIIQVMTDFTKACQRNVHDVPIVTLWRMYQNLLSERLPTHWVVDIINDQDD